MGTGVEDKAPKFERAGGFVTEESKIIEDITMFLPMQVNPFRKRAAASEESENAACAYECGRKNPGNAGGVEAGPGKLCLISNADVIDCGCTGKNPRCFPVLIRRFFLPRKAFEAGCQNLSKGNAIYELCPRIEHFHR